MKIKRIGMLLSLGLLSLSIASLINDNKEISETNTQIRTIELDKNKIDEDNFFNTFVNSNLEINEEEIIFTGLKKLKDFNISYDNVSELILEEDYNEYMSFEYIYNKKSSILTLNAYQEDETFIDDLECFIFENADGETDALMYIDGEYVFARDVYSEYIENCGWFTKALKFAASALILPFVGIPTPDPVTAFNIGFALEVQEKSTATKNYEHNKNQTNPIGYINGQDFYGNFKFGNDTIDNNGCGVIAAYNILHGLGKHEDFVDVIYEFDYDDGKVFNGTYGVNPIYYLSFFKNHNISCQVSSFIFDRNYEQVEKVKQQVLSDSNYNGNKWLLVLAWTGEQFKAPAHYVAARIFKSGRLRVYNLEGDNKSSQWCNNIDKNVMGGDLIMAFLIG